MDSLHLLIGGGCLLILIANGCHRDLLDRSIIYTASCDPQVVNGSAYDVSQLALDGVKTIIVPHDAEVVRVEAGEPCKIVMEKRLDSSAHPPELFSIVDQRRTMGCAVARDGTSLLLSTYGEFIAEGHGGTSIRLAINVPDGVEVSTRDDLSGWKCAADRAFRKADDSAQEARDIDANYAWTKLPSAPATSVAAMQRKQLKADDSRP